MRGMDAYSDDPGLSKRLTLSFNPIIKSHWIYNKYFKGIGWTDDQQIYQDEDLLILKT
jgi:phage terminase large subunit